MNKTFETVPTKPSKYEHKLADGSIVHYATGIDDENENNIARNECVPQWQSLSKAIIRTNGKVAEMITLISRFNENLKFLNKQD